MSIEKSLKDAMLTGNGLVAFTNNAPWQYMSKQHQFYSPETRTFTQMRARYASDFVEARVQGLDAAQPFAWQTRMMRFADVVKPSAAIQRHFDDYKMLLFADRDIEYIMPGSKIETMGSTWLVINPLNISGGDGMALVRRCNAVWNFLDFYGNVISEPLVAENERANANDSDNQNSLLISKGYFNILCQNNQFTRQIDTNTRFILGSGAYRVTGYADFETEYTGDYSTVRTLAFTVRYEEPNKAIDDLETHVAGGKTFSWEIVAAGQAAMQVGMTAQMSAQSVRNGEILPSEPIFPVTYQWASSDENVATVNETGLVNAIGEGSASVRVTLAQNSAIYTDFQISVTQTEDGVFWTANVPERLGAYETAVISAAYFEDGAETDAPLHWKFTGADDTAYTAQVSADGKSASVKCFGFSAANLEISVKHLSYTAQAHLILEGF